MKKQFLSGLCLAVIILITGCPNGSIPGNYTITFHDNG